MYIALLGPVMIVVETKRKVFTSCFCFILHCFASIVHPPFTLQCDPFQLLRLNKQYDSLFVSKLLSQNVYISSTELCIKTQSYSLRADYT
jgi:hypothetical protein